jgi:hypothetical protein
VPVGRPPSRTVGPPNELQYRFQVRHKGGALRRPLIVAALVAVVFSVLATGGEADGAANGVREHERRSSPYADFPLWSDVPGGPFATLGEGTLSGTRWAVYASKIRRKPFTSATPCITVASISSEGAYHVQTGCGLIAPEDPFWTGAETFSTSARIHGHNRHGQFFGGLPFGVHIRGVKIHLASGANLFRKTRLLNPRQARKTGLRRFRFFVLPLDEPACIESLVAYRADGSAAWSGETEECNY